MAKKVEINLNNINDGVIKVKFQIGTLLTWSYLYALISGKSKTGNSRDNINKHSFEIGQPKQLKGCVNNFDIIFENTTDEKKHYDLLVEWYHVDNQGNKSVLGSWKRTNEVSPDISTVILKHGVEFI